MSVTATPLYETPKVISLRPPQFRLFRDLVYRTTGISLADNKLELVQSRLQKRLRHLKLNSYNAYFDFLENEDPDGCELQQMINRITTNKTSFFREEHHFDHLRDVVFHRLIDEANQGHRQKKLRIWCAASSTGEEPYSLAMTVRDTFANLPGWDIRILASDIDTNVLDTARSAIYSDTVADVLPAETLKKHFFRGNGSSSSKVMVRPETAELVTFRQVNLLDPAWPIRTQFDVIFCRNVLIYFDQPTHDRLMSRMAEFLTTDGSLFIGHSESLSRLNDVYVRVGKTVYQRTDAGAANVPLVTGRSTGNAGPMSEPVQESSATTLEKLTRKSIIVGDVFSSKTPAEISTVLGSCIAVCLFDEAAQVGGMNHFALPSGSSDARTTASFGVHAMELLINQIMQIGGDRRRLKAKVFGGANVLRSTSRGQIGQRNAEFIRNFLSTESIPIEAEHLGGDSGMQVLFETHTGRARLKLLDRDIAQEVDKQLALTQPAETNNVPGDVTLF